MTDAGMAFLALPPCERPDPASHAALIVNRRRDKYLP
jgi:hypothetical protein